MPRLEAEFEPDPPRFESPLRRTGAVRGRQAPLPPLPDDYAATMQSNESSSPNRPRGPRPISYPAAPVSQLIDVSPVPSPPRSPSPIRHSSSSSSSDGGADDAQPAADEADDDDAPLTDRPATVARALTFYYTDLDVLVSRLDEGAESGANYDVRQLACWDRRPARSAFVRNRAAFLVKPNDLS